MSKKQTVDAFEAFMAGQGVIDVSQSSHIPDNYIYTITRAKQYENQDKGTKGIVVDGILDDAENTQVTVFAQGKPMQAIFGSLVQGLQAQGKSNFGPPDSDGNYPEILGYALPVNTNVYQSKGVATVGIKEFRHK